MSNSQVKVKSYKRKDGTTVRASTRKLTKAEKLKRKQSLGNHLVKGAKIGAAIGGTLGALSGGTVGGALGGPAGALSLGGIAAAEGAAKGAITGGAITSGAYGVKRAMAKRRDKKGFKNYFDYSRKGENIMFIGETEKNSIEFGRTRGSKDKGMRKRRIGQVAAGLGAAAAIGAGVKNRAAIGRNLRAGAMMAKDVAIAGEAKGRQTLRKGIAGAKSGVASARQKVGGKLENMGSKMESRGGYERVQAATGGGGYKKVDRGTKAAQRKMDRGAALRNMGRKIRGA